VGGRAVVWDGGSGSPFCTALQADQSPSYAVGDHLLDFCGVERFVQEVGYPYEPCFAPGFWREACRHYVFIGLSSAFSTGHHFGEHVECVHVGQRPFGDQDVRAVFPEGLYRFGCGAGFDDVLIQPFES